MRDQSTANSETLTVIHAFNAAFNRQSIEDVMALMTDDCLFENTFPAPDGQRYEGQGAVRQFFTEFFRSSPHAVFITEDLFACGDRAVFRWLYRWLEPDGTRGHVRGVDILRVRDGKVAEKLSYVKG